jgi:hypothetical protein
MADFFSRSHWWLILVPLGFIIVLVLNLVSGEINLKSGRVISRKETPDVFWAWIALTVFFTALTIFVTVSEAFKH